MNKATEGPATLYRLFFNAGHEEFVCYGVTNDWEKHRNELQQDLKGHGMKIDMEQLFVFKDRQTAADLGAELMDRFPPSPLQIAGIPYYTLAESQAFLADAESVFDKVFLLSNESVALF